MKIVINGERKTFKDLSAKYKGLIVLILVLAPLIVIGAVVFAILLLAGILALIIPFVIIAVLIGFLLRIFRR